MLKRLLRLSSPWLAAATLWVAIADVWIRDTDLEVGVGVGLRIGLSRGRFEGLEAVERSFNVPLPWRRGTRATIEGIMTLMV